MILFSVPDFATLHSAILTNKSIHDAYVNRKGAIIKAVARNEGDLTWYDALLSAKISNDSIPLNLLEEVEIHSVSEFIGNFVEPSESGNTESHSTSNRDITLSDLTDVRLLFKTANKFKKHFSIR